MNNPFHLTDQEIAELTQLLNSSELEASWNDRSWDGGGSWHEDYDWDKPAKKRRKHEWIPILLLTNTSYDCKHCGAKKEDTKGDYCDD